MGLDYRACLFGYWEEGLLCMLTCQHQGKQSKLRLSMNREVIAIKWKIIGAP